MKKTQRSSGKVNKKGYFTIGLILSLIGILVAAVCSIYYVRLQAAIKQESGSYLLELSKKTGSHIQKIVSDQFLLLQTIDNVLRDSDINDPEDMKRKVDELTDIWNVDELLLIDDNGMTYDSSGKKITLIAGEHLMQSVAKRQPAINPAQVIGSEESFLFTIPVEDIYVEDIEIRAIGATYRLKMFDSVLSTGAFDGKAYTIITNLDGTIVIPSSSENAAPFGYNAISYLSASSHGRKNDISQMESDIKLRLSGQIECSIEGEQSYVTYYPLVVQDWCLLTVVPVSVANAKSEQMLLLTLGFCIFITFIITGLFVLLAINFIKNKRVIEKIAFIDPVTNGNTLSQFLILAKQLIKNNPDSKYSIVYTNMEKFRIINEQYGRAAGDYILSCITRIVSQRLKPTECMGRIVDDHFCMLVEQQDQELLFETVKEWYGLVYDAVAFGNRGLELPISQFGIYIINDRELPLDTIIDRARFAGNKLALQSDGRIRIAVYDELAHQRLIREKHLEDRMERALEQNEFLVYLQPKYCVEGEKICGAEALVRWYNNQEGMIYPNEFIPLFERNGFIVKLDLWVFEQVCKMIDRWIEKGIEPVRISVNCSRVNFSRQGFTDEYKRIIEKYKIPPEYLEIEVTESVVYENMERINEIIAQIHGLGVECSIDDFGSGYSSLSMIKEVEADTLKLDRIFFKETREDGQRGQSVVKSIVAMAKALSMKTVAEGVEEPSQIKFLKHIGCDYIQGYVFAKPMPDSSFEELILQQQNEK